MICENGVFLDQRVDICWGRSARSSYCLEADQTLIAEVQRAVVCQLNQNISHCSFEYVNALE